jgi:hypothetical protein
MNDRIPSRPSRSSVQFPLPDFLTEGREVREGLSMHFRRHKANGTLFVKDQSDSIHRNPSGKLP